MKNSSVFMTQKKFVDAQIEMSVLRPLSKMEIEVLPAELKMLADHYVECRLSYLHTRLVFDNDFCMFALRTNRPWEGQSITTTFIPPHTAEHLGKICNVHTPRAQTSGMPCLNPRKIYVYPDDREENETAQSIAVSEALMGGLNHLWFFGTIYNVNLEHPTTVSNQLLAYHALSRPSN